MLGFVKESQLKDKVWAAGKKTRLWSDRLPTSRIIFIVKIKSINFRPKFFLSVYVKLLRPQWLIYSKWHSNENYSWGTAVGGVLFPIHESGLLALVIIVFQSISLHGGQNVWATDHSVSRRLRQTSLSLTFSLKSKINESWANWKSILIQKKKKIPVSTCFLYNALWALGPDFLLVYHIALSHLGDADNSLG